MNMQKILQEAKKMQTKIAKEQEELENKEFEGVSSLVSVKMNGKHEVLSISLNIDKTFDMNDKDMLEDMILLAVNDANKKIQEEQEKTFGKYGNNMFGMM